MVLFSYFQQYIRADLQDICFILNNPFFLLFLSLSDLFIWNYGFLLYSCCLIMDSYDDNFLNFIVLDLLKKFNGHPHKNFWLLESSDQHVTFNPLLNLIMSNIFLISIWM